MKKYLTLFLSALMFLSSCSPAVIPSESVENATLTVTETKEEGKEAKTKEELVVNQPNPENDGVLQ